ncbi:MAG: hypothetical protein CFE24_14770 [Flavobacterium sp. BFFFF2]|nr:MAG: hypothetical protein CFE24_14770 [Flavobacterium sp. BFFFF2]
MKIPIIYKNEKIASINEVVFNNISLKSEFHLKELNCLKVEEAFFFKDKEVPHRVFHFNHKGEEIKKTNSHFKLIKVLLIIESPHKDEYDINFVPIGTAQGQTGRNISKNFYKLIQSNKELEKLEKDFEVTVYNPIPLQTSMYEITKCFDRNLRNSVWKYCWNAENGPNFKSKFIEYIVENNDFEFIINACTNRLKKYVCEALNSNNIPNHTHFYHPSFWGSSENITAPNKCIRKY